MQFLEGQKEPKRELTILKGSDDLRKLTLRNGNKVIIGNININFFPAKFDQVKEVILKNMDN